MFVTDPWVDAILRGVILSSIGLTWVVVLVRINGLRTFSKMTNFDFVTTVAIGSLLAGAGQAGDWTGFTQTIAAIGGLITLQFGISKARKHSDPIESFLQNAPAVLMRDGAIDEEALRRHRVTKGDVTAKLREANALKVDQVHAVVLEATGDISVLHGDEVDERLLSDLRRSNSLRKMRSD